MKKSQRKVKGVKKFRIKRHCNLNEPKPNERLPRTVIGIALGYSQISLKSNE